MTGVYKCLLKKNKQLQRKKSLIFILFFIPLIIIPSLGLEPYIEIPMYCIFLVLMIFYPINSPYLGVIVEIKEDYIACYQFDKKSELYFDELAAIEQNDKGLFLLKADVHDDPFFSKRKMISNTFEGALYIPKYIEQYEDICSFFSNKL